MGRRSNKSTNIQPSRAQGCPRSRSEQPCYELHEAPDEIAGGGGEQQPEVPRDALTGGLLSARRFDRCSFSGKFGARILNGSRAAARRFERCSFRHCSSVGGGSHRLAAGRASSVGLQAVGIEETFAGRTPGHAAAAEVGGSDAADSQDGHVVVERAVVEVASGVEKRLAEILRLHERVAAHQQSYAFLPEQVFAAAGFD